MIILQSLDEVYRGMPRLSKLRSFLLTGLIEDFYHASKLIKPLVLLEGIGFFPASAFMTFSSSVQQTYMEHAHLPEPQALRCAYAWWHICSGLSCP
jgi:hypothetical protein